MHALGGDLIQKEEIVAAGIVGSISTLYRLIENGKFPPGTKIGAKRFWRRQEIEALFVKSTA
ncbi:helix-turn-helix transcriptional regulator [Azospirillum picis]|uniref:DNA-binding transcriptional regulator AlpA n=2 Tax=Azospirillum picis TaxID=488438 RepID=A0ABU0MUX9_9PROT|nr:helix-turn-helix domain-containing protein [Azospirillum picis]MBP2303444.1 putative DNA-binding transcriptional regulator AlpA [Azospirillum picis]MDQ0537297.1 putative DNA-binding transcriptional regulator AlpA [Azospirillum picis]